MAEEMLAGTRVPNEHRFDVTLLLSTILTTSGWSRIGRAAT
jgi:hypothetical protein